jgi:hypothetical protein
MSKGEPRKGREKQIKMVATEDEKNILHEVAESLGMCLSDALKHLAYKEAGKRYVSSAKSTNHKVKGFKNHGNK